MNVTKDNLASCQYSRFGYYARTTNRANFCHRLQHVILNEVKDLLLPRKKQILHFVQDDILKEAIPANTRIFARINFAIA